MSPQETQRQMLISQADSQARSMLGVPLDEAFAMLDGGKLDGTIAEAEMKMFRFLLNH